MAPSDTRGRKRVERVVAMPRKADLGAALRAG
jgi:hypothetical protein